MKNSKNTTFDTAIALCQCFFDDFNATYTPAFQMVEKKKYPFKKATLSDCGGDTSKRWRITYYAFDIHKNVLVRVFDYQVNRHDNPEHRRLWAQVLISRINKKLEDGFYLDSSVKKVLSVSEELNHALSLKKNAHETNNTYASETNLFCKFLKDKAGANINTLTREDIYSYIDHMNQAGYVGKTINSKLGYLSALISRLKKRKLVTENIFTDIDREKEILTRRNMAYDDHQIKILAEAIPAKDTALWQFVQIIYYTFLRPNEIRQLQVYNIQLSKKKIFIDGAKSKNKKAEYIMIPDGLIDTLIELVKNKSSNEYLFPGSRYGTPVSKNRMTDRHSKILESLKMNNTGHTLYSWKHTGVVRAFLADINIKAIQLQCRHHSILETDNYLKSLGMFDNAEFQMKMPALL